MLKEDLKFLNIARFVYFKYIWNECTVHIKKTVLKSVAPKNKSTVINVAVCMSDQGSLEYYITGHIS